MDTPPAFFPVMGSPTKKYAKNMVKTGPSVPRIAESMGVAIVMPTRNVICVRNSPRKAANAMRHRSPFSTCSFGKKKDRSQNSKDAPIALKVNSTYGLTASELAISLHSTTFNPNMVYAAAMERCPLNWSEAVSFTTQR